MVSYLNVRLAQSGLFIDAVRRGDARMVFRLAAECCVGIREIGSNNGGPLVELMQQTIGSADHEPWCMSAVQTWLAYAERVTGVKSPIIAGEHCLTVWSDSPKEQRVRTVPGPGAIIIWRHGNTSSGHTGVTCEQPSVSRIFSAVEANTESGNSGGKIERDGGGVYYTKRSLDGAGSMHIVGFLKPF